jgi:hypothetical protein
MENPTSESSRLAGGRRCRDRGRTGAGREEEPTSESIRHAGGAGSVEGRSNTPASRNDSLVVVDAWIEVVQELEGRRNPPASQYDSLVVLAV